MPYKNTHRRARISPTKVRPVMELIRGKRAFEAESMLELSNRRAAAMVLRCLDAAMANAQYVDDLSEREVYDLVVTEARVDSGSTFKRWQPKDRGRAHPIKKRTSHITVVLDKSSKD